MAFRRYHRSKPTVRTITVRYAGKCVCCGATINPGQIADYYPVGTIAGVQTPQIAHLKAMEGNSVACSEHLKNRNPLTHALNEDGPCSDLGYEDNCKERCGL